MSRDGDAPADGLEKEAGEARACRTGPVPLPSPPRNWGSDSQPVWHRAALSGFLNFSLMQKAFMADVLEQ